MATYPSNTGVGAQLEILGLKGQYIVIALISITILFVIAVILSSTQFPVILTIIVVVATGTALIGGIIRLNQHFGQYGLLKYWMLRKLPTFMREVYAIRRILTVCK